MKLVNVKNNKAIIEFKERETFIYNKFLENEMRSLGILIPHGLRGSYQGKDCVFLGEEGFQRAFQEVYYFTHMDQSQFKWMT